MRMSEESGQQKSRNTNSLGWSGKLAAKRTRWFFLSVIIIVGAISGFLWVKSFSSPKSDLIQKQEAAAFLREEETKLAEQLIKDFPNSEVPLVLMGGLQAKRGNSSEGMIFWEKALRLNPNLPNVYCKMAEIASGREEFEKAIELWKKALQINPKMRGVRNDIARAFIWLGKYNQAVAEAEEEIKISPRSAISYYLLGQGYLQLKEYDKAKFCYEKVIELEPNHPNAHYGLAGIYMRLKQPDKAREHMDVYKEWKDGRVKSVWNVDKAGYDVVGSQKSLGTLLMDADRLYRTMGKGEKAEELLKHTEKIFKKAISLAPAQPHVQGYMHRELALLYLRMKRKLPEAEKFAAKAVEFEATAANYYVLCRASEMNGDLANARTAIEKAVELEPENMMYRQTYELIKSRSR